MQAQGAKGRLEMLSANVVVVDVDAVRCDRRQKLTRRALMVVEGSIEAEVVADVANLGCRTDAADDARCAAKYGPLWQEYRRRVPYRIVPRLY
jgi:hypothetical protein